MNFSDYEERYPNGKKSIWYKKAKLELFAPYSRVDGMVRSITKYEDYSYNEPIFAYETYANRGDKLYKSEKDLTKEIATDFYGKDRPDACKCNYAMIIDFFNSNYVSIRVSFFFFSTYLLHGGQGSGRRGSDAGVPRGQETR